MSQMHYEDLPLEEVVSDAEYILAVRAADPAWHEVSIPIEEPSYDGQDVPPYSYRIQHYLVERVIRGPEELLDKCVQVRPSDHEWMLDVHTDYYVRGLSKSPIIRSYQSKGSLEEKTLIVFLSSDDQGLRFIYDCAMESLAFLDEVLELEKNSASSLCFDEPESVWTRLKNLLGK